MSRVEDALAADVAGVGGSPDVDWAAMYVAQRDQSNGLSADVTIEKVVFASGNDTFNPPAANGLYAVADALVSIPAAPAV
jgi:hypothetical protein